MSKSNEETAEYFEIKSKLDRMVAIGEELVKQRDEALSRVAVLEAVLRECKARFIDLDGLWSNMGQLAQVDDPRPSIDARLAALITTTLSNVPTGE